MEETTDGRHVYVTHRTDGKTVINMQGSVREVDPRTIQLKPRDDGQTAAVLEDEVDHGTADSKRPPAPTGHDERPTKKKRKSNENPNPPSLAASNTSPRRRDISPAAAKPPPSSFAHFTAPTHKSTPKMKLCPSTPTPPESPKSERMETSDQEDDEASDALFL